MAPGGCGPDRAARTTRHSQGLGKHNKPLIITVSPRKPVILLWARDPALVTGKLCSRTLRGALSPSSLSQLCFYHLQQ